MDFVVPLRQPMTTMRSPKTQKHDKSYLQKIHHPPHLTPWSGINDTFLMLEDFCSSKWKIQNLITFKYHILYTTDSLLLAPYRPKYRLLCACAQTPYIHHHDRGICNGGITWVSKIEEYLQKLRMKGVLPTYLLPLEIPMFQ